jgi:hypothetical protein
MLLWMMIAIQCRRRIPASRQRVLACYTLPFLVDVIKLHTLVLFPFRFDRLIYCANRVPPDPVRAEEAL